MAPKCRSNIEQRNRKNVKTDLSHLPKTEVELQDAFLPRRNLWVI